MKGFGIGIGFGCGVLIGKKVQKVNVRKNNEGKDKIQCLLAMLDF